jgi:hypothetical protein
MVLPVVEMLWRDQYQCLESVDVEEYSPLKGAAELKSRG